jgi:hypothetical protein
MSEFFDRLIMEALFKDQLSVSIGAYKARSKEFDRIYREIIDLAVIGVFENFIDSEPLCIIFKSLSPTERLVVLLHILMDYRIDETANIIGTNRDSVYSLKHRALKKFQAAMEHFSN